MFIAREYLSHASTYLEFPQQAFTCDFHDRPSLKTTTKHEDFKNSVKIAVYGWFDSPVNAQIKEKSTSKHRSYRLQLPVNRKFKANGEKNFVEWWICLAVIAFSGGFDWRQSRLAVISACRTPATSSTLAGGEKSILPCTPCRVCAGAQWGSLSTMICEFFKRSNFQ